MQPFKKRKPVFWLYLLFMILSLTVCTQVFGEGQAQSKPGQKLLRHFQQTGYDFGWSHAAVEDAKDDSKVIYRSITDVRVQGDQVEIDYAWHDGHLSGKLTGTTYSGTWKQDNGQGNFQLIFEDGCNEARGWWNDNFNSAHRLALIKSSEGGLRQLHFQPGAGEQRVPTGQTIAPAGRTVAFAGRPLDMIISQDGRTLFIKAVNQLLVLDAESLQPVQIMPYPSGESASMHGLTIDSSGETLYISTSGKHLLEACRDKPGGRWRWGRQMALADKNCNPCGVALAERLHMVCACLSMRNSLALIDL